MNAQKKVRTGLLATVSSIALLGYACAASAASDDDGRPALWVEVGGQAERLGGQPELLAPPFFAKASLADLAVLIGSQRQPLFSTGFDGKISFQPEDSDWIFSAAIRYGRSSSRKQWHHQTAGKPAIQITFFGFDNPFSPSRVIFADAPSSLHEAHTVLDFQAGKDIGLGLFGVHGESVVSAGVRFAQFTANNSATIHARPFYTLGPLTGVPGKYSVPSKFVRATYTGILHAERNAHAVGPSLSWSASLPMAGSSSQMTLNFDWGVNAAVLFGRQRARVHHQTTGYHYDKYGGLFHRQRHISNYANIPPDQNRSHMVTIPNAGAFAGLSLRSPHAKISLGYRADVFFGAIDGGIDARKEENRGFYGPFASISVGLGD